MADCETTFRRIPHHLEARAYIDDCNDDLNILLPRPIGLILIVTLKLG